MARRLLAGKSHAQQPSGSLALLSLARSLEVRDPATKGHAQRVAAYARQLASRLGWGDEAARQIELAGLIHDIGKLVIPVAILTKPAPLTDREWRVVQRHPVLGEELCRPLPTLAKLLPVIRCHHERWDGLGYPDGLKGTAIPLWARLLAVADSFDALTSDRAYRRGLSSDAALEVLEKGAGQQWDPDLVMAFIGMYEAHSMPLTPALWTAPLASSSYNDLLTPIENLRPGVLRRLTDPLDELAADDPSADQDFERQLNNIDHLVQIGNGRDERRGKAQEVLSDARD